MAPVRTGLLSWYRDLPLSKKIYLPHFLLILLLVLPALFTANKVVNDLIIRRSTGGIQQSLDIIMQSLNSVLNSIEEGASRVAADSMVQAMLVKPQRSGGAEGLDNYYLVRSIQDKILHLRNTVDSVSVYTLDGSLLGTGYIATEGSFGAERLSATMVQMSVERLGQNVWIDPGTLAYSAGEEYGAGVTMLKAIRSQDDGSAVGVLRVAMSGNIFSNLYSHLDYGRNGRFIVVDRQGVVVFPEAGGYGRYTELLRSLFTDWNGGRYRDEKIYAVGDERFLVAASRLERLGWTVIGIVPMREVLGFSQNITLAIYLIGLGFIGLEMLFAFLIARSISRPIVMLSESMTDAARGDLQIRIEERGNDEIGKLSRSFNEMVEKISRLMDRVSLDHKRRRELELLALQSQINPHFLYNSLESICALSQLNRNEEAYRLGKALSMFYRGVLSGGRPIIRIGEETETIRNYLTIQETRYEGKLTWSVDMDEQILEQKIVKLSLQPIAENAIYHGLKRVRRKGHIRIVGGSDDGERIRITVEDNGIGMSSERIEEILPGRSLPVEGHGFGLSSVDQRLRLSFGEEYGISIESRPDCWTKVHLFVPFQSE